MFKRLVISVSVVAAVSFGLQITLNPTPYGDSATENYGYSVDLPNGECAGIELRNHMGGPLVFDPWHDVDCH